MRTKFLTSKPVLAKTVIIDGEKLELRNPTLKQRRSLERDSKGDGTLYNVLAVIACTYIPETDTPVFEAADQEALLAKESGGLVDVLAKEIAALIEAEKMKAETAAKN